MSYVTVGATQPFRSPFPTAVSKALAYIGMHSAPFVLSPGYLFLDIAGATNPEPEGLTRTLSDGLSGHTPNLVDEVTKTVRKM